MPRPGTGDAARQRPQTHRLDGDWDRGGGEGRGVSASKEPRRRLQRRPRIQPRQAKWGGGSGNWGGWGKRATRKRLKSCAAVNAGRWSPRKLETGATEKGRTTNPRTTRPRPWCREAPEGNAPGRGVGSRHRKRKRSTVFWAREPGKYSRVILSPWG